ncbi:histidine phosphatase family protein [Jeotgalibacillus haloalkalitolerans]|uniref:Histidine phosphatase family protein n=1 Tax=Jeotgalibacillus haloalkalitolerans TaxID=3104292 RepID=A0ABU5KKF0_9BACL|nr:histidine phosphatase family protein [Jeotgalibacillus sp. HH7-29]MDZ5711195.1 histidine phosphatase family protein [Jeotgalibacillus sp. HH7-29]
MESDTRVVLSLYRHGVTKENQDKVYIGWSDVSISQDGVDRLHETKAHRPDAERVVISDLKRCVESADILFPDQPKIQHRGLREINFGEWEGRKADELQKREDFAEWLNNPELMQPENGESFKDFSDRVMEAWKTIREWCLHDEVRDIAIVAHGGPIRKLLTELAPEEKDFWDWKPLHGEGLTLVWKDAASFGRGDRCTLLSAVPSMANENG